MSAKKLTLGCMLFTLITALSGCLVEPAHDGYREGYYDRDHHRYWHEHSWHECMEHDDPYCR